MRFYLGRHLLKSSVLAIALIPSSSYLFAGTDEEYLSLGEIDVIQSIQNGSGGLVGGSSQEQSYWSELQIQQAQNSVPLPADPCGPNNPRVAIVDSGIDATNPEFAGLLASENLHKNITTGQFGFAAVVDEAAHGTLVAGAIAARVDDASPVSGIAKNLCIIAIKVTSCFNNNCGGATTTNIVSGINYAMSLNPRPDVLVVSFENVATSSRVRDAALAANNLGSLVFLSAGNTCSGTGQPCGSTLPLDSRIPIVAATERNPDGTYSLATYSNWGSHVTFGAPGTDILTTLPNGGGSVLATGTTMSTALSAGIYALTKQYAAAARKHMDRTRAMSSMMSGGPLVSGHNFRRIIGALSFQQSLYTLIAATSVNSVGLIPDFESMSSGDSSSQTMRFVLNSEASSP